MLRQIAQEKRDRAHIYGQIDGYASGMNETFDASETDQDISASCKPTNQYMRLGDAKNKAKIKRFSARSDLSCPLRTCTRKDLGIGQYIEK